MATATRENRYVLTAEDRTRMAFQSLERNFNQTQRMLTQLRNLTAGAFSVAGLVTFANKMAEAERVQNRLTATINAQGHAAGFTRRQLDDMAGALAAATEFDDDAFTSAQAELLKFGNIYNDVFKRALDASADLASFNNTDLLSSTQTIARALQNPVEGLKAFEQQLGKLDPTQKKVLQQFVEQNRVVDAQNKLLDILHGKIGGTATLMNTGYLGAIKNVEEKWDDFLKTLGRSESVATGVVTALDSITKALKFLDNAVKGPADSEIQERLVKRLEFELGTLKQQRGARFGALPGDLLPWFLDPAETERRIRVLEEQLKWARVDLDQMRQLELKELFGDSGGAGRPPAAQLSGLGARGARGGRLRFMPGPEVNRNLLGLNPEFFTAAMVGAYPQGGEDRVNALGLTPEYFQKLEMEQRYNELALRQKRELVAAAIPINAAAEDYLRGIRGETDLLTANARQRQHMLDQRYLEFIGLKSGTPEWEKYVEQIARARDAQDLLNRSWEHGAQRALMDYLDTVRNVSSAVEGLVTRAFNNMEDALVEFVQTGKLSFRSLAESILEDLIRIQVRQSITGPLSQILGSAFGSVIGGKGDPIGFAHGGSFMVGGRGGVDTTPVAFMATRGERVTVETPAQQRRGATNIFNVDMRGASLEAVARLEKLVMMVNGSIESRALGAVRNELYRGGPAARIAGSR